MIVNPVTNGPKNIAMLTERGSLNTKMTKNDRYNEVAVSHKSILKELGLYTFQHPPYVTRFLCKSKTTAYFILII